MLVVKPTRTCSFTLHRRTGELHARILVTIVAAARRRCSCLSTHFHVLLCPHCTAARHCILCTVVAVLVVVAVVLTAGIPRLQVALLEEVNHERYEHVQVPKGFAVRIGLCQRAAVRRNTDTTTTLSHSTRDAQYYCAASHTT